MLWLLRGKHRRVFGVALQLTHPIPYSLGLGAITIAGLCIAAIHPANLDDDEPERPTLSKAQSLSPAKSALTQQSQSLDGIKFGFRVQHEAWMEEHRLPCYSGGISGVSRYDVSQLAW
jgi:hypothetical protein